MTEYVAASETLNALLVILAHHHSPFKPTPNKGVPDRHTGAAFLASQSYFPEGRLATRGKWSQRLSFNKGMQMGNQFANEANYSPWMSHSVAGRSQSCLLIHTFPLWHHRRKSVRKRLRLGDLAANDCRAWVAFCYLFGISIGSPPAESPTKEEDPVGYLFSE